MKTKDPFSFMFKNKREERKLNQSIFSFPNPRKYNTKIEEQNTNPSTDFSDLEGLYNTINDFSTKVVPIVKQYGPYVKNLPALWQLVREFSVFQEETENGVNLGALFNSAKYKSAAFFNGGEDSEEILPMEEHITPNQKKRRTTKTNDLNGPKLFI